MGQIRELVASALVQALVELGVPPQVVHHLRKLVIRSRKVIGESASGEVRRYFGAEELSATNASDVGT